MMGARTFFGFQLLVVGALVLASASHAQRVGCAPEAFRALFESRDLISARSAEFRENGLLPEGGGICGPVCALNVLHVVDMAWSLELQLDTPVEEVAALRAQTRKRRDIAAHGMTEPQLRRFLQEKLEGTGVEVKSRHYPQAKSFSDEDFAGENFLAIAGVRIFENTRAFRGGHFVILKSADRARQMVTMIDPNKPHRPLRVPYHPTPFPGDASVPTYEFELPDNFLNSRGTPQRYILDGLVRVEKSKSPR